METTEQPGGQPPVTTPEQPKPEQQKGADIERDVGGERVGDDDDGEQD